MKIISPNNPVIVQRANGCNNGYSNAFGKVPTQDELDALQAELNKRDKEAKTNKQNTSSTTSSSKSGINPNLLSAGADIFTQLGTALIGRQRTYTDVEQRCGKKPIGKKKLAEWNKCASSADLSPAGAPIPTSSGGDETKQGLSKGAKIGIAVGGLAVVGLVIFLVMKSGKK
jgi:hypothetical protein